MNLNMHDKALLIALRKGNHFKANPGEVGQLLNQAIGDLGPSEGLSSARRLHANGLALIVRDDDRPGATLLRITDDGIALADNLMESSRSLTWREKISAIPRSDWISIFALFVSAVALFKGD
jgi:hypothetical protein